jgi:hypothetical protein
MHVSQQPPNSPPANTPPTEFSVEKAFRNVQALAREPRAGIYALGAAIFWMDLLHGRKIR